MKKLIGLTVFALLLGGATLYANQHSSDKAARKQGKHQRGPVVQAGDRSGVAIAVSFSTEEVRVIREYYAPRYRKLPPGLQKKLARTGTLPPGWQKKMEPFPEKLERQLVVLSPEYRRGVLDGHAVIYSPKTQVMIDVAVLF
jgi:hypothetical protein